MLVVRDPLAIKPVVVRDSLRIDQPAVGHRPLLTQELGHLAASR
jgi:hypothetical protein